MNPIPSRLLLIPVVIAALLLAFVYLLVPTAQAETIDVCAACSVTSIQTAVNQANPGDTIQLFAETYIETVNITQSLTLVGVNEATTILDGNDVSTVITVSSNIAVSLQNLTIQNGLAEFEGGGILNQGELTLSSVTVRDNAAETGGGIYNVGTLLMNNSGVLENRATFQGPGIYNEGLLRLTTVEIRQNMATAADNLGGGGIYNTNGGQVTLEQNSVVAENEAALGAGILNQEQMTITDSLISDNRASDLGGGMVNEGTLLVRNAQLLNNEAGLEGGGLFNTSTAVFQQARLAENEANAAEGRGGAILNGGTLTMTQSSLLDNRAYNGGAVHNLADVALVNVTVSGNIAGNAGAGVYSSGNSAVFQHVTFFNNIAAGAGSAVYQIDDGSVSTTNSVLARGTSAGAGACSGTITSGGGNLSDDTTCALTATQDRNGFVVNLNPLNADGVHLPALNSLVIDNGIAVSCPAVDQLGRVRPFGAGCDSGAVETAVYRLFTPFVLRQ